METLTPSPKEHVPVTPMEWSAPMHAQHDRTTRWYVVGGVFALGCIAYALWTKAWSFAVVMVLVCIAYVRLHKAPPAMGTIRFEEEGCTYNGRLSLWKDFKDFWIVKLPDYSELHIARKRGMNDTVLQTGDIPSPVIRAFLSQFLPERKDQGERVVDKIIRLCKL